MKRLISIVLILTMVLSFTACSSSTNPDISSSDSETSDSETSIDYYPITITDHAGRNVTIEKEPERLVSCYYITSSLLMALGLSEKIVGMEDNPDYRPIYELSAPYLLELPWVGTAKTLDLDACASVDPDLVLLPLRLKDSAEILEDLGINVLLVNPESQTQLLEMIRMVGDATNTKTTAETLISFLEKQETYLTKKLFDADTPTVYLAGNSDLLSTAGNAMYQSDMIRLAGGVNVAADIEDAYWAQIDYEQLLTWNPDYIILASNAQYTVADVLNNPNLAGCTAITNEHVYQIPCDAEAWDSPVPSSILGAFWLATILHPDLLTGTESTAIMNEYYETFYQFTYSEN